MENFYKILFLWKFSQILILKETFIKNSYLWKKLWKYSLKILSLLIFFRVLPVFLVHQSIFNSMYSNLWYISKSLLLSPSLSTLLLNRFNRTFKVKKLKQIFFEGKTIVKQKLSRLDHKIPQGIRMNINNKIKKKYL